jgi:hypothetical protein
MSRLAAIPLTLLTLTLLTACRHDVMRTPVATSTIATLPTLTAAQTRGLVSVPWTLQGSPTGDMVFVEVPEAACPRLRGAVVTSTPAAVTLQIFATLTYCSSGPPGAIAAPVRLPSPLGARELHHGPVMPAGEAIGTRPPAR